MPAGWGKIKTTLGALITVGARDKLRQIDVMVRDVPDNVTFEQYVERMNSYYSRMGVNECTGPVTISGIEGHQAIGKLNIGGYDFRAVVCSVMKREKAYSVVCMATDEEFSGYENTFDMVAESIVIR